MTPVLAVENLCVTFPGRAGPVRAVDGVSWSVSRGEVLGVVGESGSGKTVSALAVMGLLAVRPQGRILLEGVDLTRLGPRELRKVRGRRLAMVFQDASGSFSPTRRVGAQIAEVVATHQQLGRLPAAQRALELLEETGLLDPERWAAAYPHELSGGMLERAALAAALAGQPDVLIADEPTAGLDAAARGAILEMLDHLVHRRDMALVLISHDLAMVARHSTWVATMYAGRLAELGSASAVFERPRHGYTHALVACTPHIDLPARPRPIPGQPQARAPRGCAFHPRCAFAAERCSREQPLLNEEEERLVACHFSSEVSRTPLYSEDRMTASRRPGDWERGDAVLEAVDLTKRFRLRRSVANARMPRVVTAVDGVSFVVGRGRCLALVGESGCGKTTTARMVLGLLAPSSGHVVVDGVRLTGAGRKVVSRLRRKVQMVFQDPLASLNPRMTAGDAVAEPLRIAGQDPGRRVPDLFDRVGLSSDRSERYPHELSGGERQRVAIARALALGPKLIVLDEPVSSLDVSIQAQILELLGELRSELDLSLLLIAHDLSVVRHLADAVAVMHAGRIVERGPTEELLMSPAHPLARALVEAGRKLRA